MKYISFKLTAALLGVLSFTRAELKDRRQIEAAPSQSESDSPVADKDGSDFSKKGSKYFQDIYIAQLAPDEIEFGHVRENPVSWEQRFEKIDLDDHRHRGKVKWGDKYGGYGEHYFDFNHGGKEETEKESEKESLSEVKQEDPKAPAAIDVARDRRNLLRTGDVEFINDAAKQSIVGGATRVHGGNYKALELDRIKRQASPGHLVERVWKMVADE